MAKLICRYCGKEVRAGAGLTSGNNPNCSASPNKKHVLVPNPPFCVYCGKETKSGAVLTVGSNPSCIASPDKKHKLA